MQRRIPHALSEKIMLTVTKVNDYCYYSCAYALMALKAGANEAELHDLLTDKLRHIQVDK